MSPERCAKSGVPKNGSRHPRTVRETGWSNVPSKGSSASGIREPSPVGDRLKNRRLRPGSCRPETNPEQLNLSVTLIKKSSSSSEEEERESPSAPRVSKNLPEAREEERRRAGRVVALPSVLETERRPRSWERCVGRCECAQDF